MRCVLSALFLFLLLLCFSAPQKSRAEDVSAPLHRLKYRPSSAKETEAWQSDVRAKLFSLLKLHREKRPPLNARMISFNKLNSYSLYLMEINSTSTRRIQIRLTMPPNRKQKLPAVICLAGHGDSLYEVYYRYVYHRFPTTLASSGYVTASVEIGKHQIFEKGQSLVGQRLWDLMRCVDYLSTLPLVDPKRIGVAGLSLGGEMAMWLGAMDPRISATVSSGFLTRMKQLKTNHCPCWNFPGLSELVEFSDIYSLIAPRPLLCQNGVKEAPTGFTVALASESFSDISAVYRSLGAADKARFVAHPGGHEIDLPSLLKFFDENLKK